MNVQSRSIIAVQLVLLVYQWWYVCENRLLHFPFLNNSASGMITCTFIKMGEGCLSVSLQHVKVAPTISVSFELKVV